MQTNYKAVTTHGGMLIVGLLIGFFAGREYLKYEIRETFAAAAHGISSIASGAEEASSAAEPKKSAAPAAADSPIMISLLNKGFREHDYQAGIGDDAITFELGIRNNANQTIRAFDGTVTFTDLLGNEIISSNLAINDPVGAHQTVTWDGQLNYNQFIAEHQRFRAADARNMKVVFAPRKILFSDGHEKTF